MTRIDFKGSQESERGGRCHIKGYFNLLPEKDEFKVKLKGRMTVYDGRDLTHDFDGSISQLSMVFLPKIDFFTNGNLGEKLLYRFETAKFGGGRIVYSGRWCPAEELTLHTFVSDMPDGSKYAELEFSLRNLSDENIFKEIGLLR